MTEAEFREKLSDLSDDLDEKIRRFNENFDLKLNEMEKRIVNLRKDFAEKLSVFSDEPEHQYDLSGLRSRILDRSDRIEAWNEVYKELDLDDPPKFEGLPEELKELEREIDELFDKVGKGKENM